MSARGGRAAALCRSYPVWSYCLIAFAITWGLRFLYARVRDAYGMPAFNFALIASFGPSLSALLLVGLTEGRQGLRRIGRSVVDWRVGAGWILMAGLFEFGLFTGIALLYLLRFGAFPEGAGTGLLPALGDLAGTFLLGLFRWGLAEEIGWRGWMLPKLQRGMSPFAASLILSAVATLWHLHPDTLGEIAVSREGTYLWGHYSEAAERLIITVPFTLVLTFLYNRTRGSLLIQVIFHSASNTSFFWVAGVFGIVGTDFFRAAFLAALLPIGALFSLLVWRQKGKVTLSGA